MFIDIFIFRFAVIGAMASAGIANVSIYHANLQVENLQAAMACLIILLLPP